MIVAGIVLYDPDKNILMQNIEAIESQVSLIILIDNASSISLSWLDDYVKGKKIEIIKNVSNMGIAYALNQIMKLGNKMGADWVLTLDQDSVCPKNLIESYSYYLTLPMVAILSPVIKDRNNEKEKTQIKNEIVEIERCITSASLNKISVWKKIGGFNEMLFIDYVDFEYCCRVRENGYKIYRVNNVVLLHRLGIMETKKIGKKIIHVTNHNTKRRYYYARNACYCHKWHKAEYPFTQLIYHLGSLILKILLYENDKINKLKEVYMGIRDSRDIKDSKINL